MFFPPIQAYLEEHGLSDISTRRFGNFTMQVGQTYSSASQGMSHHDWYTLLAAASWLDGAGRFGSAVNLASNWNAIAPKPTSGQSIAVTPEMRNKILWGEEKAKPRQIRGGHSPDISNNNPNNIKVTTLKTNSDGTKYVQFDTTLPNFVISKPKKTTLFPKSWSSDEIIKAVEKIANTDPIASRVRDGSTLHRAVINGVEINVIIQNGKITSGYPTGTKNAKPPGGFE